MGFVQSSKGTHNQLLGAACMRAACELHRDSPTANFDCVLADLKVQRIVSFGAAVDGFLLLVAVGC